MKIALFGYGKMGKTIEKVAAERGHEILFKITKNPEDFDLKKADVAIDFSIPSAALKNIQFSLEKGVSIISGTTGWLQDYGKAVESCKKTESAFLYASNFSPGMNIFFELNKKLAEMMNSVENYSVEIEETHHLQKLDAPSGTAITLAEQIIQKGQKSAWVLGKAKNAEIPIVAKRVKDVPGTHVVSYKSKIDSIKIEHIAHSREGFALGAILAAEWILGKKGVFSMKDVLF